MTMARTKSEGIQDFGEHIGGARKELFAGRNIMLSDLDMFDNIDVENYVNKSKIWKTPKWEELVEQGYDKSACYFIKLMRDAFPTKPHSMTVEEAKVYTALLEKYRDEVMKVKTPADINAFRYDDLVSLGLVKVNEYGRMYGTEYYARGMEKAIRKSAKDCKEEAMKKDFLYDTYDKQKARYEILNFTDRNVQIGTDWNGNMEIKYHLGSSTYFFRPDQSIDDIEERINNAIYDAPYGVAYDRKIVWTFESLENAQKFIESCAKQVAEKVDDFVKDQKEQQKKDRKQKFQTEPLAHIRHSSPFGDSKAVVGDNFLEQFNIRGGEFGNWLNENDRQENMNAAFDAFKDLARALEIEDADIGLGNKLNIAFGARGVSRALAHYESDREVINLTKMKGAGSLAHEFFHAMDNIYAKTFDEYNPSAKLHFVSDFASSPRPTLQDVSPAMRDLMQAIMYKELNEEEAMKIKQADIDKKIAALDRDIMRVAFPTGRSSMTEEQKDAVERLKNYVHEQREKVENGGEVRNFTLSGRGMYAKGKWVTDKDFADTIKKFAEEIGKGHNLSSHNIDWLAQQIDTAAHQVKYIKEAKLDTVKEHTDFYKDAQGIDKLYSKSGHGYWSSPVELTARAFAVYVKDKLEEKGITNDYLCGHAETAGVPGKDGATLYTYPRGEERERINKAFDAVIEELRQKDFLHQRSAEKEIVETLVNQDTSFTVSLSGSSLVITDNVKNEQQKLVYSSPEKALEAYENAKEMIMSPELVEEEALENDYELPNDKEEGYQYSLEDVFGDDR